MFAFAFGFGWGASVFGLVFCTLICTRFFVLLAVSGSIGVRSVFANWFLYIAVFYFVLCVGVGRGWERSFLEAVFHHDLTGNAVAVHGVTHIEQRLESVFDHFRVTANHKPCGFRGELGMQRLFDAVVF